MAEQLEAERAGPKRRFFQILGPGLIAGASDDDPSGIATYSQVGAQFGFAMSWAMLFSFPLMAAIQEISARIGRCTGRGIADNIRRRYPPALLYGIVGLVLVANTINLGADLGAMADALRLLAAPPTGWVGAGGAGERLAGCSSGITLPRPGACMESSVRP